MAAILDYFSDSEMTKQGNILLLIAIVSSYYTGTQTSILIVPAYSNHHSKLNANKIMPALLCNLQVNCFNSSFS